MDQFPQSSGGDDDFPRGGLGAVGAAPREGSDETGAVDAFGPGDGGNVIRSGEVGAGLRVIEAGIPLAGDERPREGLEDGAAFVVTQRGEDRAGIGAERVGGEPGIAADDEAGAELGGDANAEGCGGFGGGSGGKFGHRDVRAYHRGGVFGGGLEVVLGEEEGARILLGGRLGRRVHWPVRQ